VRFVPDVRPYALMKTRLLNAGHLAIGCLGRIAGLETIDEAMRDQVLGAYAEGFMGEVAPSLPVPGGFDLDAYQRSLLERLRNEKIADPLVRLSRGGSLKMGRHILPSIHAARRVGRPHPLLTLAVAGWCRHLRGVDDRGRRFGIDDPQADRLQRLARLGGSDPRLLLGDSTVFGRLGCDEGFARELSAAQESIDRLGARGAIAAALDVGDPVAT
jgi:fructuronate reductase/mannitol 2-dehydrogenase